MTGTTKARTNLTAADPWLPPRRHVFQLPAGRLLFALVCSLSMMIAGLSLTAVPVSAQENLALEPGNAQILRTSRGARIVVIGNPQVASASVASDEAIVVTAKVAGRTNLIALDEEGSEILRRTITVSVPPVLPSPSPEGAHVRVRSIGGSNRAGGELVRNYICPDLALCVLTNSANEAPAPQRLQIDGQLPGARSPLAQGAPDAAGAVPYGTVPPAAAAAPVVQERRR